MIHLLVGDQVLSEYFAEQGGIANSRFTIILSEVEVETPQECSPGSQPSSVKVA